MKRNKLLIILVLIAAVIIGLYFVLRNNPPKVIGFTPKDKSTDVTLNKSINIIFDRKLTDSEKTKVNVKINPLITDEATSWVGQQLVIATNTGLTNDTNYLVEVLYNNAKLASFS